jgi:SAM-dependent methyltransferase
MSRPGDEIAEFYEQHPYPPPAEDLDVVGRNWADGRLRRIEHHLLWPGLPDREGHSILVAGCGTSQAARYAIRHPRSQVVGIDVSRVSLEHSASLARRHRLTNLDLRALPIEDVAELGRSFDQVVCTGVLHHLVDPEAGLRALGRVLAPGGAMQLMVYGRHGRVGVSMIQEYCRLLGIRPEPDEIDDLVATLRELPLGHPLSHVLRTAPDFADADALADALLNPRDRAYSVRDVFGLIDSADLRFLRWTRQAPYLPDCGVLAGLAHGQRIAALPVVEQYAAVELFRGTMSRHSFIVQRGDEADRGVRFDADADEWRDHVPIRTATSIAVEDRLPPGAAAALLNRAHTDRDLVLFATPAEKQVFDLIDGRRTAGEIGDAVGSRDGAFFRRLWRHDLIVVDTSGPRPA